MDKKVCKNCLRTLTGVVTTLAAVKTGWILYSKRYIDHHAKLNIILDAEHHTYHSPFAGAINFYVNNDGDQTPLLLIHGLHLYAGLYDALSVFEAFRTARPVYAIDLPGFGGSEKTDRPYRPSMYQEAISDFIKNQIGKPCHVLTLGNASAFASMAEIDEPEWIRSMIMINPTGFEMPHPPTLKRQGYLETARDLLLSYLKVPLWSLPIYDFLASRARITTFYHKRFAYSAPSDLIDLAYTSAHQAGAHFAPIVLLSGKLNVPEVREKYYEKLSVPVFVVYDNEPGTCFDMLPQLVREKSNWRAFRSRNTRGMPHFERTGELFREFEMFWKKHDK
ncbi:MAG: alpha/beta hydrolase [Anaerolineaceae bacterium]|jgi:pimeloyl-ACP methyl ester carboxylesterase|nr:alpha/beta hydrolase [Anaerolineaceae bacterium]